MKRTKWENDNIQFPRLLAEIAAVGLSRKQYTELEDSMDLEIRDIDELFDRAEYVWQAIKAKVIKVKDV